MPTFINNAFSDILLSIPLIGAYVVFALGIVVIFRASRVLNLAHGAMAMAPAYVYYQFSTVWHLPVFISLIVGVTSGAYSSIFIASPLLVMWKHFDQRKYASERAAAAATEATAANAPRGIAPPMRRIPPKQKRPIAPPPRYRRKRPAESAVLDENRGAGVLTQTEDAGGDGDADDRAETEQD